MFFAADLSALAASGNNAIFIVSKQIHAAADSVRCVPQVPSGVFLGTDKELFCVLEFRHIFGSYHSNQHNKNELARLRNAIAYWRKNFIHTLDEKIKDSL